MASDFGHSKHRLSLRLTESAVFLRSRDPLSRRTTAGSTESHPGVLRGLLILHLERPMKITSIVVNLKCTTTTTWPEGFGPRRLDVSETHDVFSYDQTFFKAHPMDRRRSSLGPGVRIHPDVHGRPASAGGIPTTPTSHNSEPDAASAMDRRRFSIDLSNFQPEAIEQHQNQIHLPDHARSLSGRGDSQLPSVMEQAAFRHLDHSQESGISSSSSIQSPHSPSTLLSPRHNEDGPTFSPSPSSSHAALTFHEPSSSSRTSQTQSAEHRGRRSKRLSLGAVFDAIRSPTSGKVPSRESSRESSEERGRSSSHIPEDHDNVFTKLRMHGNHHRKTTEVEEWKEFRPGTYTYAITIPIPADQPPSLECAFGGVEWTLKATVHRPGTFKSKLTRSVNVNVIHSPIEEDQEELDGVMVERHWDQQLQYLVSLSARHFYIGGTVPFSLTLLPLSKCKIHKLTVYIEERVDYLTQMSRVVRNDPPTHLLLLSVKNPKGCNKPILPLDSEDPDAFQKSPLYQLLGPDDDPSEFASDFMGPGPWTFRKDFQLPASCSTLHWTNQNKRSNILITHLLKCVMRVERQDESDREGKGKLYDIVIQTEIEIRSCRCNPELAGLPPYARTFRDPLAFEEKCPCERYRKSHSQGLTARLIASRTSSDSDVSAAETSSIDNTMASLRETRTFYRDNAQYDRLVSGQETEAGEAPPPYSNASR